jgi:hypothetical protein
MMPGQTSLPHMKTSQSQDYGVHAPVNADFIPNPISSTNQLETPIMHRQAPISVFPKLGEHRENPLANNYYPGISAKQIEEINMSIKAEITAYDAQGNPMYNLHGRQVTKR